MEKRISYSQFQQVKSAAKMMDPNMRKIESLKNKIMPLVNEMKSLQAINDSLEEGIVKIVGLPVYQLVKKVIEPTGTTGKDGKPIKVTKYLPTDMVSYDEQKKQYVITVPDVEQQAHAQASENNPEPAAEGQKVVTDEPLEASEETSEREAAEAETMPW